MKVYGISNKTYLAQGLIKVGKTRNDAADRPDQTWAPDKWRVLYEFEAVEQQVHLALKAYQYVGDGGTEWFRFTPESKAILETLAGAGLAATLGDAFETELAVLIQRCLAGGCKPHPFSPKSAQIKLNFNRQELWDNRRDIARLQRLLNKFFVCYGPSRVQMLLTPVLYPGLLRQRSIFDTRQDFVELVEQQLAKVK